MIPIVLAVAATAALVSNIDKSTTIDSKALRKYARAFNKAKEAELIVKEAENQLNKRLLNVAKKKRSIIEVSLPKFAKAYDAIQKVEIHNKNGKEVLSEIQKLYNLPIGAFSSHMDIVLNRGFTDKELMCELLRFSLPGASFVRDSERFMSAASKQMSAANVAMESAKTSETVYVELTKYIDQLLTVLLGFNSLFLRSISQLETILEELDSRELTEQDEEVMMNTVNLAYAVADVVKIPAIDETKAITQKGIELLNISSQMLEKMNQVIKM